MCIYCDYAVSYFKNKILKIKMRPDEHKKKKNEAYKRKHGITSGAKEDKHKDLGGDRSTRKGKQQLENEKDRKIAGAQAPTFKESKKNTSENRILNSFSSSSDSDEKTAELKQSQKKTYRKRQIVSNWQKYEIQPDAEVSGITSRGEQYDKLMSLSGKAESHFRFKDELEWDQEINMQDSKNTNSAVAVDPADLFRYLSCIPLHEVLDIKSDLFTSSQLNEMTKVAKENRMKHFPEDSKSPNIAPEMKSSHQTQIISTNVSLTAERLTDAFQSLDVRTPTIHGQLSSVTKSGSKKENNTVGFSTQGSTLLANDACLSESKVSNNLSLADEDLESLLGADTTDTPIVLSVLKEDKNQMDGVKVTLVSTATSKVDESLEDWLDSVLDD